jgi:pimeloyl-ACP methyl ester carboxylesterase
MPNVFQPVLFTYREYAKSLVIPADMRVFFPTIDGVNLYTEPLACTLSRYPLIVFAHGGEADSLVPFPGFTYWTVPLPRLARCGYIVVLPHVFNSGADPYPYKMALIARVVDWMDAAWGSWISPGAMGIAGHSRGALTAAAYAVFQERVAACAFLGGYFHQRDMTKELGCGSFMTEEDRVKRPHFTSLSRGFGIGFGATPSA